jgi:membrane protein required for colicin V production
MNLYDVIIIALIALLAYRGWRAGLVGELLAWIALALGLVLAFGFDGVVGNWLSHLHDFDTSTRRILAFVVILLIVVIAVRLLARLLSRIRTHIPIVAGVNRLGGLLLGALLALIPVWLVTAALLLAPHSLLSFVGTVNHSETAHLLRTLTPRWGQSLRAYANHFSAGHLSTRLQQQLRQLTNGR